MVELDRLVTLVGPCFCSATSAVALVVDDGEHFVAIVCVSFVDMVLV